MSIKKKVAIFDIDGTIFRSSLMIELVNEFIKEGIFPKSAEKEYRKSYKRWLDRTDDYDKYLQDIVATFEKNIVGVKYSDFVKASKKVTGIKKDRVYRYTRELIKNLTKQNYYLLAISNSPKEMVENFAKKLGFDKIYGRVYELDSKKRFNGKIKHLDIISDKAKVYERAAKREGLTLKGSVGVGDTETDIAFLKLVENPICLNPNLILYRYAKRKGWKIIVERKDVIYKI
ncbi:HAD-IB family hydrolase [Patescibacteria group bacterium]|nr:HAD-IB family hydrolase [Patescibacteria group bacterium]